MTEIKVSVVIAVYNTAGFLKACLDSICGQTLKEIEIICVDDGSDDGSTEILEEYQRQDHRIMVLHNQHTGYGAASARNAGLKRARGKYLSILDSDDYFVPEMLEKAYARAESCQDDIVIYDAQQFDSDTGRALPSSEILRGDLIPDKEVFSGKDYPNAVFVSVIGAAWNMLFRRDYIEGLGIHFQSLYHADDLFFTYAALAGAKRISVIYEKLLFYRKGNGKSQSENKNIAPLAPLAACEKLKKWLENQRLYSLYETGFHNEAVRYCNFYLETLDKYEDFSALYDSIKNCYFKKFGFDRITEDELIDKSLYEWLQRLGKFKKEEYLFNRLYGGRKKEFTYSTQKIFPKELVSPEDRVVLYGAGDTGRAYYIQNVVNGYCNIVGWIDRNAEEMFKPIETPDRIPGIKFDKLLIAIENPATVRIIKEAMVSMGVPDNKIIYR